MQVNKQRIGFQNRGNKSQTASLTGDTVWRAVLIIGVKIGTPYGSIEGDGAQAAAVLEVPDSTLPVPGGREKIAAIARPAGAELVLL